MSNTAWKIDEAEITRIVGDWYNNNPFEPKQTFTRDEVKALMDITRQDMSRRLSEILKIVEDGKKLFAEYDEHKIKERDEFAVRFLEFVNTCNLKKQHWTARELLNEFIKSTNK